MRVSRLTATAGTAIGQPLMLSIVKLKVTIKWYGQAQLTHCLLIETAVKV